MYLCFLNLLPRSVSVKVSLLKQTFYRALLRNRNLKPLENPDESLPAGCRRSRRLSLKLLLFYLKRLFVIKQFFCLCGADTSSSLFLRFFNQCPKGNKKQWVRVVKTWVLMQYHDSFAKCSAGKVTFGPSRCSPFSYTEKNSTIFPIGSLQTCIKTKDVI